MDDSQVIIGGHSEQRIGMSLSAVIRRIIWLCMLPLVLFAATFATYEVSSIHDHLDAQAKILAENISVSIDNAINSRIDALAVLSQSPLLDDMSRWSDFHREAQGFYRSFGTHVTISDMGTPNRMLLNTRVSFGTELPLMPTPKGRVALQIALETGTPAVGDLFIGPVSNEPLVAIAVPVTREERVKFVILTIIDRSFFQKLVDHVALPLDWAVVIKDGEGDTIASVMQNPLAEPSTRARVGSKVSQWTVAIELPVYARWQPIVTAGGALLAAIIGVTIVGFVGGRLAGHRLRKSVASLVEPAAPGAPPPAILEIAAARQLLNEAAEKRAAADEVLRRFELLANHSRDIILFLNFQTGRILEANAAAGKAYGYSREELLALTIKDLRAPGMLAQTDEQMMTAFESGIQFETVHRRKDATTFPVEVSSQGAIIGGMQTLISVIRDITERKEAEEGLQTTLLRFYAIFSGLRSAILLVKNEARVEYANQAFCDYFRLKESSAALKNLTAPEMIAKIKNVYLKPDDAIVRISEIVNRARPVIAEEVAMQDGRTCLRDFIPLFVGGKPYGRLWHHLDISDRKKAEESLARLNENLEATIKKRTEDLHAANRALEERATQLRALAGQLTAAEQRERKHLAKILHDGLQQYLVAARMRMEVLAGEITDYTVRQGALAVEGLLGESINVSRSLAAELSPPILHDGGILAGMEWLSRFMANKHGLRVNLTMEMDSLILSENVKIFLFEAVRELLLNVVKHAKVGSAKVHVRQNDAGHLQITVSDQGTGFDVATALHIQDGATGFGLFSIYERISLIGGQFEIQSSLGNGATFSLITPLSVHEAVPSSFTLQHRGSYQAVPAGSSKSSGKIRLLLADDHAAVREGLASLLGQEADFEIVGQASDGLEALELAGKLFPDVILMDISMPGMNGIDATRVIHEQHPDIRIIGLSLYQEEERAEGMLDSGAVFYLTKSSPPANLKAAIRSSMRAINDN
jgi:PAS domain S-box-containing protein